MVTLSNEEIHYVNGKCGNLVLDIAGALDNCISNGMSYAGLSYMVAAYRHGQLNNNQGLQQPLQQQPFDGTKIAVVSFTFGCVIGAIAGWGK